MISIQELIYKLEVGEGTRWIRSVAAALGLVALAVVYNFLEFRNFSTAEAMDQSQLARNIAEGEGFTTDFIRPASLHLLQEHSGVAGTGLKDAHPDLINPPLYPLLLAAWLKVMPVSADIPDGSFFLRYAPELWITILNQLLLFVAIWQVYHLGARLFDPEVGWVSAIVFIGAEVFWRFSVSGQSTLLALVCLLAAMQFVVAWEAGTREPAVSSSKLLAFAALAGLFLGAASLTRYSLLALLIPVVGWVLWIAGPKRGPSAGALLGGFAAVVAPWVLRNVSLSGKPFGLATLALYQDTDGFPGNRLMRSLRVDFSTFDSEMIVRKLVVNTGEILRNDVPALAGSWVCALFLAGLLMKFRSEALTRVRILVLLMAGTLIPAQALGRTHLTADSPGINSENLLVLIAPLAFVYGGGMFFVFMEQVEWANLRTRFAAVAAFCVIASSSLILTLLPPKTFPLAYPPYYPPAIQGVCKWMDQKELMMSDMPWAVAWYGRRTCLWSVLDVEKDFYTLNDYHRPVLAVYLTQLTTDAKFFSQMVKGTERGWEWFLFQTLRMTNVPPGFPLKVSIPSLLNDGQLFLTDRERWGKPGN